MGRPNGFKPDHHTNSSVYADYSPLLSLSDFLLVAGTSNLSPALTQGTKQQPVIPPPTPVRSGLEWPTGCASKSAFNTSKRAELQFLCERLRSGTVDRPYVC